MSPQEIIESRSITRRAEMPVNTLRILHRWLLVQRNQAACLMLLVTVSVPTSLFGQTTLSTLYQRETQDAEALYFQGDLKRSLERMADARKAVAEEIKKAKKGAQALDHGVAESAIDILEAEVRALQGYISTAATKLKSARDVLNKRAQFYVRNPKLPDSGAMLGPINYKLGYCDILRGDLAFQQAFIDSLITGEPIVLKRCIDPYKNGLDIIRNTWKITDASSLEAQMRLMNTCDFRFVRMLVVNGELDRAMSYYQDAERLMKLDWVWIVNFSPPKLHEKALTDADTELDKIKKQKETSNAAGNQPAGNQPQVGKKDEKDEKQLRKEAVDRARLRDIQVSGFSSFSAVAQEPIALKPHGDDGLRLTAFDRDTVRVTLIYLDSLFVKSELYLAMAESEKDPTPSLEKAEQAVAAARDIAEDKLPATQFVDEARLQLARVYCKRYQESLKKSKEQPDDVVEVDNELRNVHGNAAKTYLDDAREIVDLCDERVQKLNDANPLRARLLDVRKQLASLAQNSAEIDAVNTAIARFAEKRVADKPPRND